MTANAFMGWLVLACCAAIGWGASEYVPTPTAIGIAAATLLICIQVRR